MQIKIIELIGGETGGVGKSTVASLRLDYLTPKGIEPILYDADLSQLNAFRQNKSYPHKKKLKYTEDMKQVELGDVLIEDAIEGKFNRFLVDQPASNNAALSFYNSQTEIFENAKDLGMMFTLFFVARSDQQLFLLKDSIKRFPTLQHVLVMNKIGSDIDFEGFHEPQTKKFLADHNIPTMTVPTVAASVLSFTRDNGIRLIEGESHSGVPIGHRQRLHVFNKKVYREFERIDAEIYPFLNTKSNTNDSKERKQAN